MKVLILLSAIVAVVVAKRDVVTVGARPSNNVRAYNANDGRYHADNTGAYNPNDGRYHADNTGAYVHNDQKYKHDDNKYQHQADKFGSAGNNNGQFGNGGQYNRGINNGGQYFGVSSSADKNQGHNQGFNHAAFPTGKPQKPAPRPQKKQPSHQDAAFGSNNNNKHSSNQNPFGSSNHHNSNQVAVSGDKYDNRNYRILKKVENVEQDGYHYLYETENGILAEEQGKLANVDTDEEGMKAHGFYTYTGPDNVVYTVRYTADENGFVPEGAHIPTPPPIPAAILRSLEYQSSLGKL